MAQRILMNEFKSLASEKWVHIELNNDDIFHWNIALIVLNPDSLYYGGYFKATMTFPQNYPYSPPGFKFTHPLFHPNIYQDGRLCISILHTPGDDEMSGETAAERWSPAQRVESVLISILSLLDDAEVSSPANVDAGIMLRKDPELYKKTVLADVERSKADIPAGFVMPTHESTMAMIAGKKGGGALEKMDEEDFWVDSDVDYDDDMFGGSDSDNELVMDEDEDQDQDTGSEEEEGNEGEGERPGKGNLKGSA
ncbi:ubiquitin-conjugating enzyme E2 R [Blastomyces dermatitidis ER-3]|nr:ubiquitin-conjugating enzyme E2 R [Blastomyces dermatitidis ER-3]EEQ89113.1 ubiquitin-conjugating enzyme E2 R [Blastomyces dermatitidis ER-3]EGE81565.1 ubiquitin-conjugating enzyme E2 R [Blastomyces dermatitidis ATCC 18188]EQL31728.1 ubiquitin-conjugating enzyme E2 R [Blastomyces dermatitidis ATCC 26199]